MSRPLKSYLVITVIYLVLYSFEAGWWALVLAPVVAAVAMLIVLFAPKIHEVVYGNMFFNIDLSDELKEDKDGL